MLFCQEGGVKISMRQLKYLHAKDLITMQPHRVLDQFKEPKGKKGFCYCYSNNFIATDNKCLL